MNKPVIIGTAIAAGTAVAAAILAAVLWGKNKWDWGWNDEEYDADLR